MDLKLVDEIILQSLREIGCDVDEDTQLETIGSEKNFSFIATLCKIINNDLEVSTKLPHQMPQRFAAASHLVDCCKELGFKGSLGYQTILYSSYHDLRNLLMFLIERIPKSEDKADPFQPGTLHKGKSIENEFLGKLTDDMRRPWTLEFLQPASNDLSAATDLIHYPRRLDELQFNQRYDAPIFGEPRDLPKTLGTSLHSEKSSVTEAQDQSKPKVDLLSESISGLKEKIADEEVLCRQLATNQMKLAEAIELGVQQVEQLKQHHKLKSRIALLLDEPEESTEKLLYSLQAGESKRKLLNDKFETHKQSLETQLLELENTNSGKVRKSEVKVEEKQKMKIKTQTFQEDLKNKIQLINQLKTVLAQTRKAADRAQYTSRIFDIVKSIEKQNIDIAGIIKETKSVQKAINNAMGQNQRQFTVTEDIIWNNANKKDEYSKKVYKLLISLHSEFSELIDLVENTGSIQREIRDLEDLINFERHQNVQQKLDQIMNDLEVVADSIA